MPQERFREGTKLSQGYTLQRRIGGGGFGEVFSATDESDQSTVGIKLFKISGDPQSDEGYKKLFLKEAKIISRLRHPNIVPFYWYGTEQVRDQDNPQQIEEYPYIVMAYASEGSVRTLLQQQGGVTTEQALDFIVQAANGLQYAHDRRVLHRDIKPDNFLLHKEHPKQDHLDLWVADFGIAVTAHPLFTSTAITPQQTFGTPAYMAPEQSVGVAQIPSDIYSLGVVAYELFTGSRPFSASTQIEYYLAHKNKLPSSFSEARGEKGMNDKLASLEEVVMKALQKDPATRPESMQVFALTLLETHEIAVEREKVARRIIDLAALETQKDQAPQTSNRRRIEEAPTEPATTPQQVEREQKVIRNEGISAYEAIRQGGVEEQKENYQAALGFYDIAIQLDPKNYEVLVNKGEVLQKLERNEEALEAYNQAIQLNPKSHAILVYKGEVLQRLERNEEALEAYNQAIQIGSVSGFFPSLLRWGFHESEGDIFFYKGNVLQRLERYEEALEAYDQVIQSGTIPYVQHTIHAIVYKGDVLRRLKRDEEAMEAYNQAKKLYPLDAQLKRDLKSRMRKKYKEKN